MTGKNPVNNVLAHMMNTGSRIISLMSGLMAACLIIYSGYVLYDTVYTQNQAYSSGWEMMQYRPEIIEDEELPLFGGDGLARINPDYRAWLTVYDTHIDYPVMQGSDDLYYASHDIFGESSLTGAIYMDSDNSADFSDVYTLIYGHHMDNAAMFGGLDYYTDGEYFESHREGILVNDNTVWDLTVFATVLTDAYDSAVYSVGSRGLDELKAYISENAVLLDSETAEGAVKIAAMSTCADIGTDGRTVVYAAMTERMSDKEAAVPSVIGAETPATPGSDPDEIIIDETVEVTDPGDPVIIEDEIEVIEEIEDEETPLAAFTARFQPTGSSYSRSWALINLISLIMTVYLFLPVMHLKAKYNRARLMKKINEEEMTYNVKSFKRRFAVCIAVEIIICAAAVVAFILTEDMRLPMTLIDKWTPLMLIFLGACWGTDLVLARYRSGEADEEAEAELSRAV